MIASASEDPKDKTPDEQTSMVKHGLGESTTSQRRIKARENEGQALELRKEGFTFQQIADLLGYKTSAGAYQIVQKAMTRLGKPETAEEVRSLELARLDEMLTSLWPRKNDPQVADRILKIMDRRSRYLGLDAIPPREHHHLVAGAVAIAITIVESEDWYGNNAHHQFTESPAPSGEHSHQPGPQQDCDRWPPGGQNSDGATGLG
jgi:hypothetical protein